MDATKVVVGEAVEAEAAVVVVAVETAVSIVITIRPGRTRITNASMIVMGKILISQKFRIATPLLMNITN